MKKNKEILVTGDRPTGNLHLGHYVGTLENRLALQDSYDCFFLIADLHMLTTHSDRVSELRDNIDELVIDWLSVGMDPNKSCFYLQSQIPEITELTVLISMLCSVSRVQRIPTLKEKISDLNLKENYSLGLLLYPVFPYPVFAIRASFYVSRPVFYVDRQVLCTQFLKTL